MTGPLISEATVITRKNLGKGFHVSVMNDPLLDFLKVCFSSLRAGSSWENEAGEKGKKSLAYPPPQLFFGMSRKALLRDIQKTAAKETR